MKTPRIVAAIYLVSLAAFAPAQTRISDVVYDHTSTGGDLTMDVFEPANPNGIGILWMVSGGWSSSKASINGDLAKAFNDRGMTVFEVVHASQQKFQIPEILSDINRAVRFVRFNASTYHVNPNKLGISGASSGGHLSLMQAAYG